MTHSVWATIQLAYTTPLAQHTKPQASGPQVSPCVPTHATVPFSWSLQMLTLHTHQE